MSKAVESKNRTDRHRANVLILESSKITSVQICRRDCPCVDKKTRECSATGKTAPFDSPCLGQVITRGITR